MTNNAQGRPCSRVCVFHRLIRADVYRAFCRLDRGCTSQLSVSGCQRVKPECENIYKTHLPLVRCHKWLPCGRLINRLVYLLEHNKLATNTDKESKSYKYCNVVKSLNMQQVFYERPTRSPTRVLRSCFFLLPSLTQLLVKKVGGWTMALSHSADHVCVCVSACMCVCVRLGHTKAKQSRHLRTIKSPVTPKLSERRNQKFLNESATDKP